MTAAFKLDLSTGQTVQAPKGVEIKGVSSVIFVVESGEHRLLTGFYYIPTLRNSIISLGQLDENGSHVEMKDGVKRIWDHHRYLLANDSFHSSRCGGIDHLRTMMSNSNIRTELIISFAATLANAKCFTCNKLIIHFLLTFAQDLLKMLL
jgi:hypothetical protein